MLDVKLRPAGRAERETNWGIYFRFAIPLVAFIDLLNFLQRDQAKAYLLRAVASAIKSDVSPRSRDRACWELTDPADVGHPALFRVSRFSMPNNEESDENPDQRRYQEELAHKTALLCFI
jgi:hypothetical protein